VKGLSVMKFFPAEPLGGVSYLKAMSAPYGKIEFMPTGGISAANVGAYLALGQVIACGGSWMAPQSWIAARQFERIEKAVAEAVAVISSNSERKQ
jgi:2-dehydro-3-deoxyphosphogluconate aldolase/(4S)-4-hydroxy-2-oxoglutarate aldolase